MAINIMKWISEVVWVVDWSMERVYRSMEGGSRSMVYWCRLWFWFWFWFWLRFVWCWSGFYWYNLITQSTQRDVIVSADILSNVGIELVNGSMGMTGTWSTLLACCYPTRAEVDISPVMYIQAIPIVTVTWVTSSKWEWPKLHWVCKRCSTA